MADTDIALKAVEDQIVAFIRNPPEEPSLRHIYAARLARQFIQLGGMK